MHPAVPGVQFASTTRTTASGKAIEGRAFLEQAREMIMEDERERFELFAQAPIRLNDAFVAIREAD